MSYTEDEQNLIVASSFGRLSYAQRAAAFPEITRFIPDFAQYGKSLIKNAAHGEYNNVRGKFLDPAYRKGVFQALEERGVECVTLASLDYPDRLKHIHCPPVTLFLRGDRTLLKGEHFAVVGSRRTNGQTLSACKKISGELSKYFTIISGSADGADCAALKGADCKGISVLAYGFDHISKNSNAQLISEVGKSGLLMTEHFPTVKALRYFFPIRNRIIAGLSKGVLVVSAGEKSGALITAERALEYGKELFAFPHGIGVRGGEGCNRLIKHGAILCTDTLDILEVFGLDLKPTPKIALTAEEEELLSLIAERGEAFVAELAQNLGVAPFKLIPLLSSLEIKKLIVRLGGNRYGII